MGNGVEMSRKATKTVQIFKRYSLPHTPGTGRLRSGAFRYKIKKKWVLPSSFGEHRSPKKRKKVL